MFNKIFLEFYIYICYLDNAIEMLTTIFFCPITLYYYECIVVIMDIFMKPIWIVTFSETEEVRNPIV